MNVKVVHRAIVDVALFRILSKRLRDSMQT